MNRTTCLLLLAVCAAVACKKKEDAATAEDAGAAATSAPAASAPAAGGAASLGDSFEGEIAMHTTSAHGAPEDVDVLTKGTKMRFDATGHHGEKTHVVFDAATKKMLVVLDAQHAYMEMEMPQASAMQPPGHPGAPPGDKADVTKTGKHEKVAGYDCEDWEIKEANGRRSEACVAQGIPFFDFASMAPGGARGDESGWKKELHDKKYFPLKAVELDEHGKETSRMEVTKIDKRAIDDAQFAPPAGYNKMTLPGMGAGFPGMPHAGMPHAK